MRCNIRFCTDVASAVVHFPRGGKTALCDGCLSERGPTFEAAGYRVELLPSEDPKRADR
jgi:hypothetical protein